MRHTQHADQLADQLDGLIPPGQDEIFAADGHDPALMAARHLAAARHPVMAAERVDQIEAQLLRRVSMQRIARRRVIRGLRWMAAAVVLVVFAVTVAVGIALVDHGDTRVLTPGGSAYEVPAAATGAVQPVSQPVTVRESRESSVFIIPAAP